MGLPLVAETHFVRCPIHCLSLTPLIISNLVFKLNRVLRLSLNNLQLSFAQHQLKVVLQALFRSVKCGTLEANTK